MLSKISDIVFLILIITLLFPQGRMFIGGFINNLKSKISQPGLLAERVPVDYVDMEWSMTDRSGADFNLIENKGKVVFLNLWATWCPPCVGEMPGIQDLYDKFKDNPDVAFVMVSNEDQATISKFMERKKYSFPVFSSKNQAPAAFLSRSIPTTFVISKKGEVVIREVGAINWGGKKMNGIIEDLLDE
mgnify:CR=1 FL=1